MIHSALFSSPKITSTFSNPFQNPFPQNSTNLSQNTITQNPQKSNSLFKNNKLGKKYSCDNTLDFKDQKLLGASWKTIQEGKNVPKSKSTNQLFQENKAMQKTRKKVIKIIKNNLQEQMRLCEWRSSTHFPIMKIKLAQYKNQILQKSKEENEIIQVETYIPWQEDIKYNLKEIDCLNLMNSLYILQQSLVGFQRLYNKFGYFQPQIDMIFITNLCKCKIWHNSNIWQNYPSNKLHLTQKPNFKVEIFYQKLIKMFKEYFTSVFNNKIQEQTKRNLNLIEKLIYELSRKQDFIQALRFVNEFLAAYTLKVNNRYLDSAQVNENKSKIFSKLQNTNRTSFKIKTLPVIPISQQLWTQNNQKSNLVNNINEKTRNTNRSKSNQGRNKILKTKVNQQVNMIEQKKQKVIDQSEISTKKQQNHVKTLKNSTNKQHFNEVTQSNCKTIIMNKKQNPYNRDNSFKRQSQVSICSKQTIVQKKNRFSMHQENLINEDKFQKVKGVLPNFTHEDFIEAEVNQNDESQTQQNKSHISKNQNGQDRGPVALEQDQYEQRIRNQIQKNVREKNGWLLNPIISFDNDDCAKSFQDSQPSVKAKIRDRNLSKLNRIKSSIVNSIVE